MGYLVAQNKEVCQAQLQAQLASQALAQLAVQPLINPALESPLARLIGDLDTPTEVAPVPSEEEPTIEVKLQRKDNFDTMLPEFYFVEYSKVGGKIIHKRILWVYKPRAFDNPGNAKVNMLEKLEYTTLGPTDYERCKSAIEKLMPWELGRVPPFGLVGLHTVHSTPAPTKVESGEEREPCDICDNFVEERWYKNFDGEEHKVCKVCLEDLPREKQKQKGVLGRFKKKMYFPEGG